jgi:predicted Zn-dependent protease
MRMPRWQVWVVAGMCVLGASCGGQTGLGRGLVSDQDADRMGVQAWQELRTQTPAVGDAAEQARARRVADRVLAAAGETPSAWEVEVFQGGEANAFALPGRKIGIYDGMMRLANTDAELATVLSHEIAHVERRHSAERMSTAMATETGTNLAGAALGAAGVGSPQMIAGILGLGAQYGILLPYSRNQESEADLAGLQLMAHAGYDPRAAITLWQKMEQGGGQPPAFLSTHPATGQRIQQLEAAMPQALAEYRAAR